ncbi:hypothetical protein FACS1894195_1610 [Bacteroidia bacterium]|nr:hypothetical protein FACS1894195_1610 [Bacteroidia bacterium]
MLDYSLHENLLTERTDDFAAQPHVKNSYKRDQLIELMLSRGTLVTKTDIVAVLNNLEETVDYIVRNGGTVNLPLFDTGFSIGGVFDSAMDSFDPLRHKLHVTIRKSSVLRTAEKEVKLTKTNSAPPLPTVLEVKDCVSGAVDTTLTSGGAVEINGINIKVAGENPDNGLYFVAIDGTVAKAVTIVTNKPATLIALVPVLAAGGYRVKIVTQFNNSAVGLKSSRTTIYDKILTVQ